MTKPSLSYRCSDGEPNTPGIVYLSDTARYFSLTLELPGHRGLVHSGTLNWTMTRTFLYSKSKFNLVLSDEFNNDERTSCLSDDPFWEVVGLHCRQKGNFERYNRAAIVPGYGVLKITLLENTRVEPRRQNGDSLESVLFCGGVAPPNLSNFAGFGSQSSNERPRKGWVRYQFGGNGASPSPPQNNLVQA